MPTPVSVSPRRLLPPTQTAKVVHEQKGPNAPQRIILLRMRTRGRTVKRLQPGYHHLSTATDNPAESHTKPCGSTGLIMWWPNHVSLEQWSSAWPQGCSRKRPDASPPFSLGSFPP